MAYQLQGYWNLVPADRTKEDAMSGILGQAIRGEGLFRCNCAAEGAEFLMEQRVLRLDFNGRITISLDPETLRQFFTGAVSLVPLTIKEHVTRAVSIVEDVGEVTFNIVMDPDRPAPDSILNGKSFPADQTMYMNIHLEIPELLPGKMLRNKLDPTAGPPTLKARLDAFPPRNVIYNLQAPIEFEDASNPGPVIGRLNTFPVKVNHDGKGLPFS
jgi:hypothetical protein